MRPMSTVHPVTSEVGGTRTPTGWDLNPVPLPIGLRPLGWKPIGFACTRSPGSLNPPTRTVHYGCGQNRLLGGHVARDPDTIQREIEQARTALAATLDELSERANPQKLVEQGKSSVLDVLSQPKVKYTLIAVGAVVGFALVRKLFR